MFKEKSTEFSKTNSKKKNNEDELSSKLTSVRMI